MEVIREIRKALSNEITMTVPDEFIDEDIEITIKKIEKAEQHEGKKEKSGFTAFRLNTRGFVFNREEAHER